jgi:hypothetical protein
MPGSQTKTCTQLACIRVIQQNFVVAIEILFLILKAREEDKKLEAKKKKGLNLVIFNTVSLFYSVAYISCCCLDSFFLHCLFHCVITQDS